MYYLDLMTQANLLDHSVWASPDTWTAALEHQARRKKSGGGKGGLIFGAICCIGLVVLIFGIVYLVTQRKKK
ncbi:hypothetical protein IU431_05945 [Nocardia otitidiscaviarum]|uniref:hypothetical protein n=1 Tax=Nocardia otitidiscaviarum TaxID=1823 RepID=UPI0004A71160|nr:hypothetical protein [Nocardia otitidiscaviarum]MBF6483698.1 hypothetical protein [Nocardia otitidiscaviarum]